MSIKNIHQPYFLQQVEVDSSYANFSRMEIIPSACASKRVLDVQAAQRLSTNRCAWPIGLTLQLRRAVRAQDFACLDYPVPRECVEFVELLVD